MQSGVGRLLRGWRGFWGGPAKGERGMGATPWACSRCPSSLPVLTHLGFWPCPQLLGMASQGGR